MNNKEQFTPGPTCTCEIVMRTGETLDSSLGNRPCSDISRILLCPMHTAAPAMYEALQQAQKTIAVLKTWVQEPSNQLMMVRTAGTEHTIENALAQAEGR